MESPHVESHAMPGLKHARGVIQSEELSPGQRAAATRRVKVEALNPQQSWDRFDRRARETLGVSGDEFLRVLEAGELADRLEDPEVLAVYTIRARRPE